MFLRLFSLLQKKHGPCSDGCTRSVGEPPGPVVRLSGPLGGYLTARIARGLREGVSDGGECARKQNKKPSRFPELFEAAPARPARRVGPPLAAPNAAMSGRPFCQTEKKLARRSRPLFFSAFFFLVSGRSTRIEAPRLPPSAQTTRPTSTSTEPRRCTRCPRRNMCALPGDRSSLAHPLPPPLLLVAAQEAHSHPFPNASLYFTADADSPAADGPPKVPRDYRPHPVRV